MNWLKRVLLQVCCIAATLIIASTNSYANQPKRIKKLSFDGVSLNASTDKFVRKLSAKGWKTAIKATGKTTMEGKISGLEASATIISDTSDHIESVFLSIASDNKEQMDIKYEVIKSWIEERYGAPYSTSITVEEQVQKEVEKKADKKSNRKNRRNSKDKNPQTEIVTVTEQTEYPVCFWGDEAGGQESFKNTITLTTEGQYIIAAFCYKENYANAAWGTVSDAAQNLGDKISDKGEEIGEKVLNAGENIIDKAAHTAKKVWKSIKNVVSPKSSKK